jgi:hypothetical protein
MLSSRLKQQDRDLFISGNKKQIKELSLLSKCLPLLLPERLTAQRPEADLERN